MRSAETGEALVLAAGYTGIITAALFLLNADGAPLVLLAWAAALSLLCFFSCRKTLRSRRLLKTARLLFRIALAAGTAAVLFQMSAANRSFAEAWLESARNRQPSGFFSFFVCELYALILFLPLFFACEKQYGKAAAFFLAEHLFAAGMLTSRQELLCLSLLPFAVILVRRKKWQTLLLPALCASLCALIFSLSGKRSGTNLADYIPLDTGRLMAALMPDFPLMAYIPGYGSTLHAEKPAYSVNPSGREIFLVQGRPFSTYYLATTRYASWNGANWSFYTSINGSRQVGTVFGADSARVPAEMRTASIRLTLQDDFHAVVPLTPRTAFVSLPAAYAQADISMTDSQVLSVHPALTKGTTITLYEGEAADTVPEFNAAGISVISPRILELAEELGAPHPNSAESADDRARQAYIGRVLDYLHEGFVYSLESPRPPKEADPYEYFLLSSKTGFCTWYAGSFTLLMHAAGIPCRMAEGYRVVSDASGRGSIRGIHVHAWPEVYIDGAWRVFEATAVFSTAHPFSYLRQGDRKTSAALAAMPEFSSQSALPPATSTKRSGNTVLCIAAAALLLAVAAYVVQSRLLSGNLLRQARHIVKVYAKKGIAPPAKTGWLAWKEAVRNCGETQKEQQLQKEALRIADEMIRALYAT